MQDSLVSGAAGGKQECMLIRRSGLDGSDIPSSEITPKETFRTHRREFLAAAATVAAGGLAVGLMPRPSAAQEKLATVPGKFQATDPQTPVGKATTYNNFYEFGIDKSLPAKNAHTLQTRPWTVQVSGQVKKPLTVGIDDLMHYRPLESRVYRHRCVEAWSMVIPWDGYSLSEFINFCEPLPSAKYVQFISNLRTVSMMPDLPDGVRLAVHRGPADGRSDASADDAHLRLLRSRCFRTRMEHRCA